MTLDLFRQWHAEKFPTSTWALVLNRFCYWFSHSMIFKSSKWKLFPSSSYQIKWSEDKQPSNSFLPFSISTRDSVALIFHYSQNWCFPRHPLHRISRGSILLYSRFVYYYWLGRQPFCQHSIQLSRSLLFKHSLKTGDVGYSTEKKNAKLDTGKAWETKRIGTYVKVNVSLQISVIYMWLEI